MAIIRALQKAGGNEPKAHPTEVVGYWSFSERDGKGLFQIGTRGSADRKLGNKVSQTIQLDRTAAAELVTVLRREFKLA